MANEVEYHLMDLFAICVFSLSMGSYLWPTFLIWLFTNCSLKIHCIFLETNHLASMHFANVFLPSCTFSFHPFKRVFPSNKVFTFDEVQFICFFFCCSVFCVLSSAFLAWPSSDVPPTRKTVFLWCMLSQNHFCNYRFIGEIYSVVFPSRW